MNPFEIACLSADRYLLKTLNLLFKENKQTSESGDLDTIPNNLRNSLIISNE